MYYQNDLIFNKIWKSLGVNQDDEMANLFQLKYLIFHTQRFKSKIRQSFQALG